MKRLLAFVLSVTIGWFGLAAAQEPATVTAPVAQSSDPFLGLDTYRLWPGRAEGATSDEPDQTPTLTVFRPQPGRANGGAVVVAPGGGYVNLAAILEGREVADWFTAHGVTAFVLKYRIGEKPGFRCPSPMRSAPCVSFAPTPRASGLIPVGSA